MRVLIDVAGKFAGGYIAHLKGILNPGYIPPDTEVVLVCSESAIPVFKDVDQQVEIVIDRDIKPSPWKQFRWRAKKLYKHIRSYDVDVHFNPACQLPPMKSNGIVSITKFVNLFPFIKDEVYKEPLYSKDRVISYLRYRSQSDSAKRADGVIYLTEHSLEIAEACGISSSYWKLIPHGVGENFRKCPGTQALSSSKVNILYVSQICAHKNQWIVVEAIDLVRKQTGINVELELAGHAPSSFAQNKLDRSIASLDDTSWIKLPGRIPHNELPSHYHNADLFVFASSVESFGLTLIEAMAAGLPIACSNRRPMTDLLGDAGVYFEPESPESIAAAITKLLEDDELRYRNAVKAYERALDHSWPKCAAETFDFFREVLESSK